MLCRRPSHKRHGGLWEFPGGKIREGESNLDAAHRELGEELGVEVVGVGKLLFTAIDPGSPYLIEFFEVEIKKKPKAKPQKKVIIKKSVVPKAKLKSIIKKEISKSAPKPKRKQKSF